MSTLIAYSSDISFHSTHKILLGWSDRVSETQAQEYEGMKL